MVQRGEDFSNCDVLHHPWHNYKLKLIGRRVGKLYGPYAADDITSPNRVELPLQKRDIVNVRHIQDIVEFVAVPSSARVQHNMQRLVELSIEDQWRGRRHALVYRLLRSRWGEAVLQREGITPLSVFRHYDLTFKRLRELATVDVQDDWDM